MPFALTQFPISRQGLQDTALFLIVGIAIFGVLALLRRRKKEDPRRQVTVMGILGGLVVFCYALAFTVAPNIPTPSVPFTARFERNPVVDTPVSVDAGRQIFQTNCAVCHGSRGLGDGPAAFTLSPRPVNLQLHVPQHAEGEINYWITNGVVGTGMPAWKDRLTDEQRWQVVRYLEALASGRVQR